VIYLDHTATTKPYPEVIETLAVAMKEDYYNPASMYQAGLKLARARKDLFNQLGEDLGCSGENLIQTSGATESTNMAFKGLYSKYGKRLNELVVLRSDHHATLETAKFLESQGAKVHYLEPDCQGHLPPERLLRVLNDRTLLVSLLYVNNESGTILNLPELVSLIRQNAPQAFIHGDLVQAWGKLPINLESMDLDLASFSGHKIHGPKSIGLLYRKDKCYPDPLIHGGGQQNNWRSGTEDYPLLKALTTASKLHVGSMEESRAIVKNYAEILHETVHKLGGKVNFPEALPEIQSISFPGMRGQTLMNMLEKAGALVSTSSACQARNAGVSHVLLAMGVDRKDAEGTLRISLDRTNTLEEIKTFCKILEDQVTLLRKWGM
jgi:cysteine desulfurase